MTQYKLIDSGNGKKLEKWGEYTLIRPSSLALWNPIFPNEWEKADATFTREKDKGWDKELLKAWNVNIEDIQFKISPTDFGHLGVFPEHKKIWNWTRKKVKEKKRAKILNLFAYSGGATIALAKEGCEICHVDASKPSVLGAKENIFINHLSDAPIRWIIDDIFKFLKREMKRKNRYDGIILDPPTFGRGTKKEVFKIERDLILLLSLCKKLLSKKPLFIILSAHTPGFTPKVFENLFNDQLKDLKGEIKAQEMLIESSSSYDLPCGSCVIWQS